MCLKINALFCSARRDCRPSCFVYNIYYRYPRPAYRVTVNAGDPLVVTDRPNGKKQAGVGKPGDRNDRKNLFWDKRAHFKTRKAELLISRFTQRRSQDFD